MPRLCKFMMEILYPWDDAATIYKSMEPAGNVIQLGFSFKYRKCEMTLILDLNSVISEGADEVFKLLGKPIFKLKHEIMNVITNYYANHKSRSGTANSNN